MAAHNLLANPDTFGLGRFVAGLVFPIGLMFVVITDGELFTGKMLLGDQLFKKSIRLIDMLRDWIYVYVGNFIGSLLIVFLIYYSNQLNFSNGMLKEVTIMIAVNKVSLTFLSAFCLGILCNWIVCLAVYMSRKTQDMTGKLLCCFFPICLFITSGFEHSVANMYYIPIGILAANGMMPELTWSAFFINNLLPVTLGNIAGGFVFVAMAYHYSEKQRY